MFCPLLLVTGCSALDCGPLIDGFTTGINVPTDGEPGVDCGPRIGGFIIPGMYGLGLIFNNGRLAGFKAGTSTGNTWLPMVTVFGIFTTSP